MRYPFFPSQDPTLGGEPPLPSEIPSDATSVLIVGPATAERQFFAAALRRQGYWVLEARNRTEALRSVKGCRVDLVVSEAGLRARDTATRLHERFRTAQLLFLSSRQLRKGLPHAHVIRKPVARKELLARVQEIIGRPKH